jgi:glycosyltransferase involved in cell wall biosynthesis
MLVDLIIPALNEEQALPKVLATLPRNLLRRVVVVDNGSTDGTTKVALEGASEVLYEPVRGYGQALWTGVEFLRSDPPDVVAFMDGDGADDPSLLSVLLDVIARGQADFVIGSRMRGSRERGSMSLPQIVGNHLVPWLLRLLFHAVCTDLGPMRAIRYDALKSLALVERGMGWTVEMQIRAAQEGLRIVEVPVSYRRRTGSSKISGTLGGTIKATARILEVVVRHAMAQSLRR